MNININPIQFTSFIYQFLSEIVEMLKLYEHKYKFYTIYQFLSEIVQTGYGFEKFYLWFSGKQIRRLH